MARRAARHTLSSNFVTGGIVRDEALTWREVAAVAEGAVLSLSDASLRRVADARGLVESIVAKGIRAYGVNTGVELLASAQAYDLQSGALARAPRTDVVYRA